ncbi:MAG: hypothetical protein IJS35_05150 [Firmicutes bacterium]|nr:hypothetical protein [Bacillota bacterium]
MACGKTVSSSKEISENEADALQKNEEEHLSGFSSKEEYMEKRLEEILSQADGAGKVEVMIRTSSKDEISVAEGIKRSENTTQKEDGENSVEITEEKTAVLLENKDGSQTPLIIKNIENPIEGILIVAEGGGDEEVRNSLVSAARALLGLPEEKIQVLKMK